MKTTQGDILRVYAGIGGVRKKVGGREALDLFRLKNKLQEYIDFQSEEEERIAADHGGQVAENGMILIADPEKRKDFNKAIRELREMEIELDYTPIAISIEANPKILLEDIENLAGFVDFE